MVHRLLLRIVPALLLASAGPISLHADRQSRSDDVASGFELGASGEPIVATYLNGRGPFRFVLDTGSTHTLIADSLARDLHLPAVAQAMITTSAGGEMAPVVRVERVDIPPRPTGETLASIVTSAALDSAGRLDGVIGQDLLAADAFTLDFAHRRITWSPAQRDTTARAVTLALRPDHGRFVVDLPQPGWLLRLIPDTGASDFVFYSGTDRRIPPIAAEDGTAWLETIAGATPVQLVRIRELQVGRARLTGLRAAIMPPPPTASGVDGLLPLHTFRRVTFDGRARVLIVDP
jgi:predicted aspartyl protease